jgi:hypothetical protein
MQDLTENEGLGQDYALVESAEEANLLTEALVDAAAEHFGHEEDYVVYSDANGIRCLDPSNTLELHKIITATRKLGASTLERVKRIASF